MLLATSDGSHLKHNIVKYRIKFASTPQQGTQKYTSTKC